MQSLADSFTHEVMTVMYGKRFTECSNLEDDAELDACWETLNARFYNAIESVNL